MLSFHYLKFKYSHIALMEQMNYRIIKCLEKGKNSKNLYSNEKIFYQFYN